VPREAQLATLFADVAGSTQLYDSLGDVRARQIMARCIAIMTAGTRRHGDTAARW
jgi:class 3 adenylate cyclase